MSGVVSVGVAVGAAAFAATDIAAAGLTIATALEATAALGAAVGAVGVVTGSKPLQIAGLGLGLVGGVGALATSAGLFGAEAGSTALFGAGADTGVTAAAAAGSGAGGLYTGADVAAMPGSLGGAASAGQTDIIGSIIEGTSAAPAAGVATPSIEAATTSPNVTPAAATDTGNIPQGGGEGGSLGVVDNPAAPPAAGSGLLDQGGGAPSTMNALQMPPGSMDALPTPAAPAAPAAPVSGTASAAPPTAPRNPAIPGTQVTGSTGTPATPDGMINQGAADLAAQQGQGLVAGMTPATKGGPPSMFDNLLKFAGTSGGGHLLGGVIQAGAAFISGATSTLTPAQVAALQAQANANQAAANLSQRQLSNMGQPIPVATRTPAPAPQGLINRLPPANGGPIVTGAPS